jgi:hypothetical protein
MACRFPSWLQISLAKPKPSFGPEYTFILASFLNILTNGGPMDAVCTMLGELMVDCTGLYADMRPHRKSFNMRTWHNLNSDQ